MMNLRTFFLALATVGLLVFFVVGVEFLFFGPVSDAQAHAAEIVLMASFATSFVGSAMTLIIKKVGKNQ